ncbi:inositol monophosphatase family protein [Halosegnis marinus]|uniref:fructose-bisphosphatase n=1 Tax=Halosegnis marinus TaxID=3034023 RepID=A0ABD5ZSS9_9EURY|nr:inositol monophosphatase [Halosegnis sp. DT85]
MSERNDTEARADLAERAARAGGAVAEGFFRRDVPVETKEGKTDVVTRADRDAQRQVVAAIRTEYDEDAVVGEEADELKEVPDTGPSWIIDPIDGTNNFVAGVPMWATSVAAVRDGEAVAAANALPVLGDVYTADADGAYLNGDPIAVSDETDPEAMAVCPTIWWPHDRRDEYAEACEQTVERFGDLRRHGSAQAVLAFVAAGSLDGAFTNVDANPWDTVAGALMVERAGGTVTGIDGEPWRHDSRGLVASNGHAHDELLAAARAVEDRR